MGSRGAQISIAVVCLVLGIMLSLEFQTARYYKVARVPERAEDLASQIKTVTKEKEALDLKAATLGKQIKNIKNNDQALADLQNELQNAKLAVGLMPIEGPGIKITISDNLQGVLPGDNPNSFLVHDEHLLLLANELKAAGAEAISINNQRITAMSEIRCAGTLINVNGVAIGPPFTLHAIGNPDVLYGAMTGPNGELEYLSISGLKTSIKKLENVKIPASKRAVKIDKGKPAPLEQVLSQAGSGGR